MNWIIEQDFTNALNGMLDFPVFFEIAPEKQKEPFGVLQTIVLGATRTVEFFHPLFQLDVYQRSPESAIKIAEETVVKLNMIDIEYDSTLFDSVRAERGRLIRVEDGSYKIPIEITVNCIRRN